MVCTIKVVIDCLRNTDKLYIRAKFFGKERHFSYSVHRIVATDVKEITDIEFIKYLEKLFIFFNILGAACINGRKLLSARAKGCRGSLL